MFNLVAKEIIIVKKVSTKQFQADETFHPKPCHVKPPREATKLRPLAYRKHPLFRTSLWGS